MWILLTPSNKTFHLQCHLQSKNKEEIINANLLYFSLLKTMDTVSFQTNAFPMLYTIPKDFTGVQVLAISLLVFLQNTCCCWKTYI